MTALLSRPSAVSAREARNSSLIEEPVVNEYDVVTGVPSQEALAELAAIPVRDLAESEIWYSALLGREPGSQAWTAWWSGAPRPSSHSNWYSIQIALAGGWYPCRLVTFQPSTPPRGSGYPRTCPSDRGSRHGRCHRYRSGWKWRHHRPDVKGMRSGLSAARP
jgi:hypothetical protein